MQVEKNYETRGRKPLVMSRLLHLVHNEFKIGTTWDSGKTADEIAEKLFPDIYRTNQLLADIKTRQTIARFRRIFRSTWEQILGIPFPLPSRIMPFYSSRPSNVIVAGEAKKNPFVRPRYFFHMDRDSLEKIRVKFDMLSARMKENAIEISKIQDVVGLGLSPEKTILRNMPQLERELADELNLTPEQRKKLKKKLLQEVEQ